MILLRQMPQPKTNRCAICRVNGNRHALLLQKIKKLSKVGLIGSNGVCRRIALGLEISAIRVDVIVNRFVHSLAGLGYVLLLNILDSQAKRITEIAGEAKKGYALGQTLRPFQ
jgi:hypothetical protein